MVDIQEGPECRNVYLRQVGIKNLVIPIMHNLDSDNGNSVGTIQLGVGLEAHKHAIHMSRLAEILNEWDSVISNDSIERLLCQVKERLHVLMAYIEIKFTYFKNKTAPISNKNGKMNYECKIKAELLQDNKTEYEVRVKVPITSVCPCSKAISKYGAHNQRGIVKVSFKTNDFNEINDVIDKVELSASAELYSILKRVDEKYITEQAYENPKFVEDIARDVTLQLTKSNKYRWFHIEVENFESIHNHSAYAISMSEDWKGVNENESD